MDVEVPTAAQLRKLRVVDLRKRLQSLELTQSGNKEDLISRLRQYYLDQQEKHESGVAEKGESEVREEETTESEGGKVGEGGSEGVEGGGEMEEGGSGGLGGEGGGEEVKGGDLTAVKEGGEEVTDVNSGGVEEEGGVVTEVKEGGEEGGEGVVVEEEKEGAREVTDAEDGTRGREITEVGEEERGGEGEVREEERGGEVREVEEEERVGEVSEVQEQEEMKQNDLVDASSRSHSETMQVVESEPEQSINRPTQSVDEPISSSDVAPSTVTSDYYSDSIQEDNTQMVVDNPQIAQDSLPIAPPIATIPVPAPTVPATSNQSQTTPQERKSVPEPKGKKKKKKRRRRRHGAESGARQKEENEPPPPDVEIEYVQEDLLKPGDTHYRQFHKIFELFKLSDEPEAPPKAPPTQVISEESPMSIAAKSAAAQKKQREEEMEEEDEAPKEPTKLSKKKLRKLNRLSVAQLKQLVDRPDVVEMHDVTAQDPKLLILLKSTRNTVPVPRHWCFKRKYLQGKRGIEKPPFNLPEFIKATGIMEMRQALEEKEDAKSLKQKTRERVRPKMGKLTIDYQKLHDAFFRWQTKPKMTIHGDLYYEGKEFETRLREKKPGDLSDELRRALGMPTGLGKQKFPPPWLVAMQRYGPPPSYPNLKIPGLNAPIPEECSFGYFVGGWGKPPVDEVGRPLYGDVFGMDQQENMPKIHDDEIDKQLWGELESEEEADEEEESDEDEGEMKAEDIQAGLITPVEGGLVTPSGLTSIPAGLETPEMIQLRKKKIEEAMEQGGDTPALYTVLPEKTSTVGVAVMGSSHVYDLSAAVPGATKKAGGGSGTEGVEVALDPSELDLDTAAMTARYEEQLKESKLQKEDLSDMVAEHAAKQKKRKRAATDSSSSKAKKLKEFKF